MFAACIYIQVAEDHITETCLREHTSYSVLYDCCRLVSQQGLRIGSPLSSRITCVTEINLVCEFLACETNLVSIDDDDIVTAIHVRSVVRLVLAAENLGNTGSQTSKDLIGGIDDQPLLGDGSCVSRNGLVT